jgi:hypothetical protein
MGCDPPVAVEAVWSRSTRAPESPFVGATGHDVVVGMGLDTAASRGSGLQKRLAHPGAVALPRQRPAGELSELGSGDNRGDEQHHPADLQAAAVG